MAKIQENIYESGQMMELRLGSQGLKPSAARDLEPDSGGMRQRDSEMQGT